MTPPPQVPYIGSTISLLSKASIRYEGFLYTIDQKESSVALSHVKVFGTEDRQCDRPVPPSDEIFEFIIFRASDITELKVIDTPPVRSVPDPAIIRAQNKAPPPANSEREAASAAAEANASVKNFLSQAGGPPASAVAAVGGSSSGATRLMGGIAGTSSDGAGNVIGRQSNRQSRSQQQPQQQQPLMQGQQPLQNQQQQHQQHRRYNNQHQGQGGKQPSSYSSNGELPQQQQPSRSYYGQNRRGYGNNDGPLFDQMDRPSQGNRFNNRYGPPPPPLQSLQPMPPPPPPHYRNGGSYHQQYQHRWHSAGSSYGYSLAPPPPPPLAMMPPGPQRRFGGGGRPVMMHLRRNPGYYGGAPGRVGNPARHQQQNFATGPGGWLGSSGRSRQQQQQQQQQPRHQQQRRQPSVDPIPARFTADYDFETANAEMEAELAKLVLGDSASGGVPAGGEPSNTASNAGETLSGDDGKAKLRHTSGDLESLAKQQQHVGYNKEKSFYDDISRVEAAGAANLAVGSTVGSVGGSGSGGGIRKETTLRQNALNKETFGLVGGRMRRGIGNRFYGNRSGQSGPVGQNRRALV